MSAIYDFTCTGIAGEQIALRQFIGKVLLIVNTASKCGYTPQYRGMEALYRRYRTRGFEVLGFPCNQFLFQEPGDEQAIQEFCSHKYRVSFPMFAKVDVNGPNALPLYEYLKTSAPGFLGSRAIKWNFTKFLVDRKGNVVRRFATVTRPQALTRVIEKLLI